LFFRSKKSRLKKDRTEGGNKGEMTTNQDRRKDKYGNKERKEGDK
jgi:hypothetical protein